MYSIKFPSLSGLQKSVNHDGSAWSRVDDAVLRALEGMTRAMKDKRFKYGKINYKQVDADIAREVANAQKWYEANKDSLPAE